MLSTTNDNSKSNNALASRRAVHFLRGTIILAHAIIPVTHLDVKYCLCVCQSVPQEYDSYDNFDSFDHGCNFLSHVQNVL